jgi:hypothetical protein
LAISSAAKELVDREAERRTNYFRFEYLASVSGNTRTPSGIFFHRDRVQEETSDEV